MASTWGGSWGSAWGDSWGTLGGGVAGNAILDLNTRIHRFLNDFYSSSPDKDINALMNKYLAEETTGEYVARVLQLIEDATA